MRLMDMGYWAYSLNVPGAIGGLAWHKAHSSRPPGIWWPPQKLEDPGT